MLPSWISVTLGTRASYPRAQILARAEVIRDRSGVDPSVGRPELQTRPLRALGSPGAPPHSAPWRCAGQSSPSLRFRKPGPLRRTFKLETSREAARYTRDRAPPPETRAPGRCGEQRPLPAVREQRPGPYKRVELRGSRVPFLI